MVDADLARHRDDSWFILHAAMIHTRAGHPARAMEILQATPAHLWNYLANEMMLALIHQDLGRIDEAALESERASRSYDDNIRSRIEDTGKPPILELIDIVMLREVFRREVPTRLTGKPGADSPYLLLVRSRSLAGMGREREAEQALAAALAVRPDDAGVIASAARALAETGRGPQATAAWTRALTLFDRALASHPDDATLLRARAALLARRGEWDKVSADLVRLFRSRDAQPRWFLAGTWVVGPYPFDPDRLEFELARPLPPESSPDPSRPVAGPDGKAMLAWKPVTPNADGLIDLATPGRPDDRTSAYVLARVYAPEERDAVVLIANDDWLRFWCNGELILAQPLVYDPLVPVLVHFRAGWNTLLARVSNWEGAHVLKLKLSSDPEEIARAFGADVGKKGWSDRAAATLERLYAMVPARHGAWDNRAEALAGEVARRDDVFRRVVASRPEDSLLWQERGRYLAWLGKCDEALAAYDRMIHDHPDPEDAFVEYAAILLLEGDAAAHRKWCARLAERFGKTEGPFVRTMLVRACGLAPDGPVDPSRLISWAEQAVAKQPGNAANRHALGLAHLRSGHPEEAAKHLRSSIDAGEDSVRNWYALALARWKSGQPDEAGRWCAKAEDWMVQKESEFADRAAHPTPPISLVDWLEASVLRREVQHLVGRRRLGDIVLIDRTAPAGRELRLPLGVVELRHDAPRNGARDRSDCRRRSGPGPPSPTARSGPTSTARRWRSTSPTTRTRGVTSSPRRTPPRVRTTSPPSCTWPIPTTTSSSPSRCETTS